MSRFKLRLPRPPCTPPSVAQGTFVFTVLLGIAHVGSGLPWERMLPAAIAATSTTPCAAPVEVRGAARDEARLGCATERALRHCAPQAFDALQLHGAACTRTPQGLRAAWRIMTGHPLDVNRASETDLLEVPGLNRTQAAALVAYREVHGPYATLDGLTAVPGIGLATVRNLAPWLAVVL